MSFFKQKRKQTRKALMYYLEVIDRKDDKLIGRLVDITTDGILLVAEELIEPNTAFDLKMILPEKLQETSEVFFKADCVRSDKDTNSRYYYSGFRFKSIDPHHTDVIELLISGYEF